MEYTVDVSGSDRVDALVARQKWPEDIGEELRFIFQVSFTELRTKDQQVLAAAQ
jgi:hypothetical protein